MPSIYTHIHFARDVKKELTKKNITINYNNLYELFSQSFDFLFYYNFPLIIHGRKIRKFGRYCHRNNTQDYIINIANYIKKNSPNNTSLLAYLYGSINHYALDSTMHPYINYLANKSNQIGEHTKIEFNIDAYYYKKDYHKDYYKYKIYNDINIKENISNDLNNCINYAYEKAFGVKNMSKKYIKSIKCGKKIFKYFLYDPKGLKKRIYKLANILKNTINYSLENCSLYIKKIDKSFLNSQKKKWYNISNKKVQYNYSWNELYKIALETSVTIIENCTKYINGNLDIEDLKQSIPNITYSNGNPIKK